MEQFDGEVSVTTYFGEGPVSEELLNSWKQALCDHSIKGYALPMRMCFAYQGADKWLKDIAIEAARTIGRCFRNRQLVHLYDSVPRIEKRFLDWTLQTLIGGRHCTPLRSV